MKQYISKDFLLAEIEKLKKRFINQDDEFSDGYHFALKIIISLLNTLEVKDVKEVDLENGLKEDWLFADKTEVDCLECMCLTEDMFVSLAKKYFELGLKAQKGE